MDIRKIKKLIELLESSAVSELEVHEGEEWVRISRPDPAGTASVPVVNLPAAAPRSPADTMVPAPGTEPAPAELGHLVKSPMVGTFYASPQPKARPYVELGQQVKPGEVLCIIEAMKVINYVEATISGSVLKIMVENGDPVEYGQALFAIQLSE